MEEAPFDLPTAFAEILALMISWGLPHGDVEYVLCDAVSLRELRPREALFTQASPVTHIYLLKSGALYQDRVTRDADGEARISLRRELSAGRLIGQYDLLYGQEYSTRVRALDFCELIAVDATALNRLLYTFPDVRQRIAPGAVIGRLRTLPFFGHLDPTSLSFLAEECEQMQLEDSCAIYGAGDNADRLYYIQDGILRLTEINKTVSNNTVIGETGIFSPAHERTISAVCETDLVAYSIDRTALMEVAFDHPVLLSDLMQLSINRFCRNLRESIAEQERTKSELKIAQSIQTGMIPREFPVREEFEVFASMEPAKEVGGDLYDFFFIDDDNFYFIVGDVSGKGVPAALFMAISKTLLRTEALRGLPPNEILQNANNTLCPDNEECMFVTVFCGILNIRTGELQFANAGHNPPIVGGQQRSTEFLKLHSGFVLGTIPDFPYVTQEEKLDPGDYLYVYTDGVTEAMNLEEKLFSDARLLEIMKNIDNNPATEMLAVVKDEVKDFVKEAPQSDDITMLAVRFHGPKE